jgi:hypothetical protein
MMDDPFDGFGIADESYTRRRPFQPPRRNTTAASQARRIALPVPAIIEDHRAGLSLRSELAPAYVDVGVKRWQDFTGEAAVLDGDGRTFDEVAATQRPAADSALAPQAIAGPGNPLRPWRNYRTP